METNHQIRSWADFTLQLQIRFGHSHYDDPNTQLSKLTKQAHLLNMRSDIQCEVISAKPYSLQHAIGLSKLYEDDIVPEGSSEDIKTYLKLEENKEVSEEPSLDEPATGKLYALIGNSTSRYLRIKGSVNGKKLQILVDGGSSHNFLQARVANFLGLDITPTSKFSVIVGNGENLTCAGQCKQVSIEIQDKEVTLQGPQDSLGLGTISTGQLHKLNKRREVAGCYILNLVEKHESQGANNAVADALSRRPDHKGQGQTFLAISISKFLLVEDIKREQAEAIELKDVDWKNAQHWTICDGLFLFRGRVYIPTEDATWVDQTEFKKIYPSLHLEGKVLVEGVGNVASDEVELTLEAEQERAGLLSSDNEVENDKVNKDKVNKDKV
ncbi:hypothetical protein POM88_024077 [Heracleum sosnowskyi]|uniref:Uncharacterized protein n=1 Tax=Heracleum sosnowskyi TaxID=360622 RepID=A0AAD8MVJ3_9APIA|nr:hypothetical protein POM88_024077 [Heracleum sosnowskyi]